MISHYYRRMGRVKGLKPEETRRRVIDGAAEAFAALGFEGARIADIANAAGLSTGAMYNHFESKADLLAAVVECHAGNQLMGLLASGEVTGLLDVILARGKQLGAHNPSEAPLLIEAVAAARRDREVLRVLTEQVSGREDLFVQLIEHAQATGEAVDDVDARATARFMFMVLLGSLLVQAMDLPDLDPGTWESFMTRLIDGFRPEDKQ